MDYQELKEKPFIIAGPCVIENEKITFEVAKELKRLSGIFSCPFVFKASFDKANRTSIDSYRGPGVEKGLAVLQAVKEETGLPVTTDIHEPFQADLAAKTVDILQIPAFLCRQTDLLKAAAKTGCIVNIKKAQFLSGNDMAYPAQKVLESGNRKIILTERGNMYGYNNLSVDFRNIPDMKKLGYPVVMDCTHSVQKPGAGDGITSGNREYIPQMAMAGKVFGANGFFFEIHPDPENALSDGPNMVKMSRFESILRQLLPDFIKA